MPRTPISETCFWCRETLVDGHEVAGGTSPCWATTDTDGEPFDFGCDDSPETCEEGCGSHIPVSRVREIVIATLGLQDVHQNVTTD